MRSILFGFAVVGGLLVIAAIANAGHRGKAGVSCADGSCAVATTVVRTTVTVKATAGCSAARSVRSGCSAAATASGCAGGKEKRGLHLFKRKGCAG